MTPKEKAEQLIEKFAPVMPNENWRDRAIECAFIVVDAIINELEQLRKPEYTTFVLSYETMATMDGCEKIYFWEDVKEELESL